MLFHRLGNEPERSEDSETDDMSSFYSTSQEKDTTPNFKSLIRVRIVKLSIRVSSDMGLRL